MKTMTVASAVAPLLKVQKNLERVKDDRVRRASSQRENAQILIEQAQEDELEATRAEKILANLLKLTEG